MESSFQGDPRDFWRVTRLAHGLHNVPHASSLAFGPCCPPLLDGRVRDRSGKRGRSRKLEQPGKLERPGKRQQPGKRRQPGERDQSTTLQHFRHDALWSRSWRRSWQRQPDGRRAKQRRACGIGGSNRCRTGPYRSRGQRGRSSGRSRRCRFGRSRRAPGAVRSERQLWLEHGRHACHLRHRIRQ